MTVAGPSLAMRLAKLALRLSPAHMRDSALPQLRKRLEGPPTRAAAPLPARYRRRYDVDERDIAGHPVLELAPRGAHSGLHFVYTHGGSYINPLQWVHWQAVAALVEATGASVTVPLYPLAPAHTHRDAFPVLEAVYRDVLVRHSGRRLVLCGDSAGGGLALAQALHYRDLGLRRPDHVILFAPWLDLTLSNPGAQRAAARDVVLGPACLREAGRHWAGGDDPHQPLLSPLFGDLAGLPPLTVFQGSDDVFVADAWALFARAQKAGTPAEVVEYQGGFHDFMMVTWLPESRDVFHRVALLLAPPAADESVA